MSAAQLPVPGQGSRSSQPTPVSSEVPALSKGFQKMFILPSRSSSLPAPSDASIAATTRSRAVLAARPTPADFDVGLVRASDVAFPSRNNHPDRFPSIPFIIEQKELGNFTFPSGGVTEPGVSDADAAAFSKRAGMETRAVDDPSAKDLAATCIFTFGNNGDSPSTLVVCRPNTRQYLRAHPLFYKPLFVEPLASSMSFYVGDIPGRGKGLFAARRIAKGECFLREPPLFVFLQAMSGSFFAELDSLTDKYMSKRIVSELDELYCCWPDNGFSRRIGIVRTNALAIALPHCDTPIGAVFQLISRANHSCLPSTFYDWDYKRFQGSLTAGRDIAAGEELTITYAEPRVSKASRREELQRKYSLARFELEQRRLLLYNELNRQASQPPRLALIMCESLPFWDVCCGRSRTNIVFRLLYALLSLDHDLHDRAPAMNAYQLPATTLGIGFGKMFVSSTPSLALPRVGIQRRKPQSRTVATTASRAVSATGSADFDFGFIRALDIAFPSRNGHPDRFPSIPFVLDKTELAQASLASTYTIAPDLSDADIQAFKRSHLETRRNDAGNSDSTMACVMTFGHGHTATALVVCDPATRQFLRAHPLFEKILFVEPFASSMPCYIADVPGRGKGLIATRRIANGECILREPPMIVFPQAMGANFLVMIDDLVKKGMSQRVVAALDELHCCWPDSGFSRRVGVLRTNLNGLAIGLPSSDATFGAIFQLMSRANHSCRSNTFFHWDYKTFQGSVTADRDIAAGEELTISYGPDPRAPTATRREELQRKYKFRCTCELCGPD